MPSLVHALFCYPGGLDLSHVLEGLIPGTEDPGHVQEIGGQGIEGEDLAPGVEGLVPEIEDLFLKIDHALEIEGLTLETGGPVPVTDAHRTDVDKVHRDHPEEATLVRSKFILFSNCHNYILINWHSMKTSYCDYASYHILATPTFYCGCVKPCPLVSTSHTQEQKPQERVWET